MSKLERPTLTVSDYLEMERSSSEKHEFAFGEIFAMTGASLNHNGIVGNIAGELRSQLREGSRRVCSMDMRVCVHPDYRYIYPDVVVVCDKPQVLDEKFDTLLNPDLIVEVLSESTRNYDRGDKFQEYRSIPSLRGYLLVDEAAVHVECWTKKSGGTWSLWETDAIKDVVRLESVGATLAVSEIYFKIDL